MTIERALRAMAGFFVMLSVALGYWVHPGFFLFTAFVGLNLFQSAFTTPARRWRSSGSSACGSAADVPPGPLHTVRKADVGGVRRPRGAGPAGRAPREAVPVPAAEVDPGPAARPLSVFATAT